MSRVITPNDVAQDTFLSQYLETALWASNVDHKSIDEIPQELLAEAIVDCNAFRDKPNVQGMIEGDESRAGHDFYLTREGHGAGFWDGDWPKDGDYLTTVSEGFGCWDNFGCWASDLVEEGE